MTTAEIQDQYPSTDDAVITIDPQVNPITECLKRARQRLVDGHTTAEYMAPGKFCAVGAIWHEDISVPRWMNRFEEGLVFGNRQEWYRRIEAELCSTTKAAIDLLNTVALERYPEAAASKYSPWCGPLEWVNQQPSDSSPVKPKILAIYDEAIDRSLVMAPK